MHIALLCAGRRGLRVLHRLCELMPDCRLTIFSFREEPWEPPFCDDIRAATIAAKGRFRESKQVGDPRWRDVWETLPPDLLLAVGWRYLIPREVFQRPARGSFVFHDSLLPAYRGFSPTVWAILNGKSQTGATLFWMVDSIDSGDIVDQLAVAIGPDDTIATVTENVTAAYLDLLDRNLAALVAGAAPRRPQDESVASYTCKRLPADNRIDWSRPTWELHNLIRAVSSPYPGAFTTLAGRRLTVWSAQPHPMGSRYIGRVPGRIVEVLDGHGSVALTGDGALLVQQVQYDGEPSVCATEAITRLSMTLGQ